MLSQRGRKIATDNPSPKTQQRRARKRANTQASRRRKKEAEEAERARQQETAIQSSTNSAPLQSGPGSGGTGVTNRDGDNTATAAHPNGSHPHDHNACHPYHNQAARLFEVIRDSQFDSGRNNGGNNVSPSQRRPTISPFTPRASLSTRSSSESDESMDDSDEDERSTSPDTIVVSTQITPIPSRRPGRARELQSSPRGLSPIPALRAAPRSTSPVVLIPRSVPLLDAGFIYIEGEANGSDGDGDMPSGDNGDEMGTRDESDSASDAGSHITVASEPLAPSRSSRSAGATEEWGDEDYVGYTAAKLYEQLIVGHHGCTEEQHQRQLDEHNAAVGSNHHCDLASTFTEPGLPSTLHVRGLLTPEALQSLPEHDAASWQRAFCGFAPGEAEPQYVCLHQEETEGLETDVAYDIDSFMGFATSLAAAKLGFRYDPVQQPQYNITTDIHISAPAFREGANGRPPRAQERKIRDIPHFQMGKPAKADNVVFYVLFPHLAVEGDKFTSLTERDRATWLDQIFHPAVKAAAQPHYTQYLPPSYRVAKANGRVRQVEARQVETSSYQSTMSIHYFLQPGSLDRIWEHVRATTRRPGFQQFRDPQIFFSDKGTKLTYKSNEQRVGLLAAMDHFQSSVEEFLDFDFVDHDRFWADVGKDTCASGGHQVYAWKRCCLESYVGWMYEGRVSPTKEHRARTCYPLTMLRDACALTSEVPRDDAHFRGGLVYTQFYANVFHLWNVLGFGSFSNDGLEELALDPLIRQSINHVAGGRRRQAFVLEAGLVDAKARTSDALLDARDEPIGYREEHRVRWKLFEALLARLRRDGEGVAPVRLECHPPSAWAIDTHTYLDFVGRHVDRFVTGFEVARARCREGLVTWSNTQAMSMFLRCLRFSLSGRPVSREGALWWDERDVRGGNGWVTRRYGLGFSRTLEQYGYCWMASRFDWEELVFTPQVADHVPFGSNALLGRLNRRGAPLRALADASRDVDLAARWMKLYRDVHRVQKRMREWMVHIVLRQFRIDVLRAVQRDIRADRREEALQGREPFSYEYFAEIMMDRTYLISGNHAQRQKIEDMWDFLFWPDERPRRHWANKPFRMLFARAIAHIQITHGRDRVLEFIGDCQAALWQRHWILPYPSGESFVQTREGQRIWYSVREVWSRQLRARIWHWGRKAFQPGRPPPLPKWLAWNAQDWLDWLQLYGDPHRNDDAAAAAAAPAEEEGTPDPDQQVAIDPEERLPIIADVQRTRIDGKTWFLNDPGIPTANMTRRTRLQSQRAAMVEPESAMRRGDAMRQNPDNRESNALSPSACSSDSDVSMDDAIPHAPTRPGFFARWASKRPPPTPPPPTTAPRPWTDDIWVDFENRTGPHAYRSPPTSGPAADSVPAVPGGREESPYNISTGLSESGSSTGEEPLARLSPP